MNTSALIQKVWNFCHTLKDDGVGYGDYLEQLTYLLFLKMAHEYTEQPYNRPTQVPFGLDWPALRRHTGAPLEAQYLATLHELGQQGGMLGAIFFKAQNKIQDPAKLSRLVQMIDAESWVGMDADTKGDLYEGLLQKNAEDTKSGAGQYFTPRAVIQAMVECVRPEPMRSEEHTSELQSPTTLFPYTTLFRSFIGSGRTHSTIARITARGVKYWPAPLLVSSALRCSRLS